MVTNDKPEGEMTQAQKFDKAMTELDAAIVRAALQPTWERAKRDYLIRKAERAAMSVRLDEGRY